MIFDFLRAMLILDAIIIAASAVINVTFNIMNKCGGKNEG